MRLSVEQIREMLGFQSHHVFAAQQRRRHQKLLKAKIAAKEITPAAIRPEWLKLKNRATGRTTEMLLEAVFQSQFESVAIKGYSLTYTHHLVREARTFAKRCGLDPGQIIGGVEEGPSTRGKRLPKTFYDHHTPPNMGKPSSNLGSTG